MMLHLPMSQWGSSMIPHLLVSLWVSGMTLHFLRVSPWMLGTVTLFFCYSPWVSRMTAHIHVFQWVSRMTVHLHVSWWVMTCLVPVSLRRSWRRPLTLPEVHLLQILWSHCQLQSHQPHLLLQTHLLHHRPLQFLWTHQLQPPRWSHRRLQLTCQTHCHLLWL